MPVKNKTKISRRHQARTFVLQALYKRLMTNENIENIKKYFKEEHNLDSADITYFNLLLAGVIENIDTIDEKIKPYLDRDITELSPIEISILRIAFYELIFRMEVAHQIIINEAIELAKTFGGQDGYKYVNGVLDNAAKNIRSRS